MYTPQARIKGSSYQGNRHIIYSLKRKEFVDLFSDLEFYNFLLLECNPRVIDYCVQPLIIKGEYNGKPRKAIFDVWVKYIDGYEEFQEIKPSSCFIEGEKGYNNTIKQTFIQKSWCINHSKNYVIRTERDILENIIMINNLIKIYNFVRPVGKVKLSEVKRILEYLESGPKSIADIVALINLPIADVYTLIFSLIYTGKCTSEDLFTKRIDLYTVVTLGCLVIN